MAKKKIVLCDSNVLFDYFRGVPVMVQELEELGFDRLYLSVISEAEMYVGMKRSEKRKTTETINKLEFNIEVQLTLSAWTPKSLANYLTLLGSIMPRDPA